MGKKRYRSSYTSKGQRPNVAASTLKLVARERSPFEKEAGLRRAWRAGQNPWVTVPGPSTKERWVRERANKVWGDPRNRGHINRDEEIQV